MHVRKNLFLMNTYIKAPITSNKLPAISPNQRNFLSANDFELFEVEGVRTSEAPTVFAMLLRISQMQQMTNLKLQCIEASFLYVRISYT